MLSALFGRRPPGQVRYRKKNLVIVITVNPMTGKLWLSQSNRRDLSDGYAVIGLGRFGLAVCEELVRWGAEVLAIDDEERAVDELRQVEPSIEARLVDCADEEAMREAGVLQVGTVVVAIAGSIEANITAALIAKDAPAAASSR